jgi:acetaldehyde dehydrogenase (acetylating)
MKVGILGTGNIGTDLLMKLRKRSRQMEVAMFAGIDPHSEGLARAKQLGVPTSAAGIEAVLMDPDIQIVFEATSAATHVKHAPLLRKAGKVAVDLTPAAVGPFVVPSVRCEVGEELNVNLVSCGGQAVIPMVYAVSRVAPLEYAETVTTIASKSAGPGTRANIDEFTVTTARGVKEVGDAPFAKSIIILNPANPPILKQNTIYALTREAPDQARITASVHDMVRVVQGYVPGYRLRFDPVFEGNRVTIMVEVEGAGDFFPAYAGNLDIITSAAVAAGDAIAERIGGAA